MDPRHSAQDVHRCDLCEIAIVHSYCDFCHVNLCKPCILDHILDEYDKHKIVPFKERRSTLIYPKCGSHPRKNCELQCKECNIFVCSFCIASNQHNGHNFVEVTEVYMTSKDIIKRDLEELETLISPKYEEIVFNIESQLASIDVGYDKLTSKISEQKEEWHKEIDKIINRKEREISEIKVNHKNILQKHLGEIKQIQSLIIQTLLSIKEIEKSVDISLTVEYRSKIKEFSKLPPKVQVSLPTFISTPLDREKLNSLFGQITPLSTATEENVFSLDQPNNSVGILLDEPKLVSIIETGHKKLRNVSCLNENRVWTSGWTNEIQCFNIKGSLLQTIKTKSGEWPGDIAVNSDGDVLYSGGTTVTVNRVINGQSNELIRLQGWRINKMCISSTFDLLVTIYSDDGTESKVVCYKGSTEKQTIQFDGEGKPLYSENTKIKYITVNRNHDICVADLGAGAIVVVNQTGKLRWRYSGHPKVTNNKPFKPLGITTDSQSRILTTDRDSHCIHILDQNGQFLRYIDNCDLKNLSGLCVDYNDNLFVCESVGGHVKKIKYFK